MCKGGCKVISMPVNITNELTDPAKKMGFTMFKVENKIQLKLNGEIKLEIDSRGRMYEMDTFIRAYAQGYADALTKTLDMFPQSM